MAGIQDFETFVDDFDGAVATFPTSADPATPWVVTDTSSTGTPTYTKGTSEATLTLESTSEVQNVCLDFKDALQFDIDDIIEIEMRVKMGQSALNAATQVAFGLASERNDAIDSITEAALFRVVGGDDTTAVVVETDDGTNNNDDISTGKTLADSYKRFVISFAKGTDDVRFLIDGDTVATATTFDMSNYSDGLQPYVQIQKTADTNTDSVVVDYVKVRTRR